MNTPGGVLLRLALKAFHDLTVRVKKINYFDFITLQNGIEVQESDLNFIRQDNEKIVVNTEYIKIYLFEDYFTEDVAQYFDEEIETLGIFYMQPLSSPDQEYKAGDRLFVSGFPMMMRFPFEYSETEKIMIDGKEEKFMTFVLKKDTILFY